MALSIRQLEGKLNNLNHRGLKFAMLGTLNRAAFETQAEAKRGLSTRMQIRNKWTERSIRVNKASTSNMQSVVGSTQEYMKKQETGGTERASGRTGVAIATSVASGEGRGAKPRKKLVRRPNKVSSIALAGRMRTGNRKQRNAVAVKTAVKTGKRYVFLELQRRKGLFRVYGGKRNPRIEMVHDLSRKTVRTPRNPWLMPAATREAARQPRYYAQQLALQLKRLR